MIGRLCRCESGDSRQPACERCGRCCLARRERDAAAEVPGGDASKWVACAERGSPRYRAALDEAVVAARRGEVYCGWSGTAQRADGGLTPARVRAGRVEPSRFAGGDGSANEPQN
jgi:hypothetical protein